MRAAAIQLNASEDTARNLATADRLVRKAASLGAEPVALPVRHRLPSLANRRPDVYAQGLT